MNKLLDAAKAVVNNAACTNGPGGDCYVVSADIFDALQEVVTAEVAAEVAAAQPAPVRQHDWGNHINSNWEMCKVCGVVRRADDQNKPCRGPARLTLRKR